MPVGSRRCQACSVKVRLDAGKSVELHVTGKMDEVESVTRRLAAELAPSEVTVEEASELSSGAQDRWVRSRRA